MVQNIIMNMIRLFSALFCVLAISFSTYAHEVIKGLPEGARVITSLGSTGNVTEVLDGYRVLVKLDENPQSQVMNISDLGITERCVDHVCVGTRAIDHSGLWGEVKEVFSNNWVRIKFDLYPKMYSRVVRDMGVSVDCVKSICTGDRIAEGYGGTGTIKEIFHNGWARIKYDDYDQDYLREIRALGVKVTCFEGFCEGQRVIDRDKRAGEITEVFSNGRARVKFDGHTGTYFWTISSLSKAN